MLYIFISLDNIMPEVSKDSTASATQSESRWAGYYTCYSIETLKDAEDDRTERAVKIPLWDFTETEIDNNIAYHTKQLNVWIQIKERIRK